MKKILSIFLLSILLASCGKVIENKQDTENKYYFKEVPKEWTLPSMEGITSFEILMQKEYGVNEKFDTQNERIVMQPFDCFATFNNARLYRAIRGDGMTQFYELDSRVVRNDDGSYHEEDFWRLSDNTF